MRWFRSLALCWPNDDETNIASVKLTLYRCPFNGSLTVCVCFNRRWCLEWLYNLIYLTHFTLDTTVGLACQCGLSEHNVFCVFRALSALGLIVSIRVSRCWMKWVGAIQCCAKRNNSSKRKCQALASWEWESSDENHILLSLSTPLVLINLSLSTMLIAKHVFFRQKVNAYKK